MQTKKKRCKPKYAYLGEINRMSKKAINTVLTFENSSLGAWVQLLIEFHFGPHGPTLPGSTENGIYIITTWQMWPPLSFQNQCMDQSAESSIVVTEQNVDVTNGLFFKKKIFIWLHWALVAAWGIQFPDQGPNPGPLHWKCGVLATGPPGKPSNDL